MPAKKMVPKNFKIKKVKKVQSDKSATSAKSTPDKKQRAGGCKRGCTDCTCHERSHSSDDASGFVSSRLSGISPSATLAVSAKATALQRRIDAGEVREFGEKP